MNKHKEFYIFTERNLVDEKERVSLKQLGYYIKSGESYHSPKRFSITELKYFILEFAPIKLISIIITISFIKGIT